MFKREERYTIIKIEDAVEALTPDEKDALIQIEETIAAWRKVNGKQPLKAVVVEDDWPEYETVWDMIEKRVTDEDNWDELWDGIKETVKTWETK
jgi:hypothetical protein